MNEEREKVLVVDDDDAVRSVIRRKLELSGIDCITVASGEEGIQVVDDTFSAVLMDLRMPGRDGVSCIRDIKKRLPGLPCIVISGADDLQYAVEAMKAGAFDYLQKPLSLDEVALLVRQAIRTAQLDRENRVLRSALGMPDLPRQWIAASKASTDVLEQVRKVANSPGTVLIKGETGTGKSLLARVIHSVGNRAAEPFVTVSCGTLPRELVEAELFGHEKGAFTGATKQRPGRVELAGQGTLYLDQIEDLPLSLQSKVLRMLQEREFERVGGNKTLYMKARVITSASRDIQRLSREGDFREDLFYRLSVLPVEIPALRYRKEDIEPIATEFIAHLSGKGDVGKKLSADAIKALKEHDWPGNVRELQNVLERAYTFSPTDTITAADLIFLSSAVPPSEEGAQTKSADLAGKTLEEIEKAAVEQTLDACGGNKAKAARALGISEKSIYNKIKRLGIQIA